MKAIVMLSGGLDSTLCLAIAKEKGRDCIALSFDYQQKHSIELEAAKSVAAHYECEHKVLYIDPTPLQSSALLGTKNGQNYVPARNTIFLAYATALAESSQAEEIYFGANADDEAGFCDCRPPYLKAWGHLLTLATNQAVEGNPPKLIAPLLQLKKKKIIQQAVELNVPIALTQTCYTPPKGERKHCGFCHACLLRKKGFAEANVKDPTHYTEETSA